MENLRQEVLNYLEASAWIHDGLLPLKPGASLGIRIDQSFTLVFRRTNEQVLLHERRGDEELDLEFLVNFEGIRHLLAQKNLDLTGFAVEMIKQASLGNLNLRVHKSFIKLLRLGYVSVLNQAGAPFWSLLGQYGFGSLGKISQLLQKLRS